jgi:hypothetical protein
VGLPADTQACQPDVPAGSHGLFRGSVGVFGIARRGPVYRSGRSKVLELELPGGTVVHGLARWIRTWIRGGSPLGSGVDHSIDHCDGLANNPRCRSWEEGSCLIRRLIALVSALYLTVSWPFVPLYQGVWCPLGGLTIEITQFPVFFGQFAYPMIRLLAGPVSLRHTVSELEGGYGPGWFYWHPYAC